LLQIRNTFFLQIMINFCTSHIRSKIALWSWRHLTIHLIQILINCGSWKLVSLGTFRLIVVHFEHYLAVGADPTFQSTSLIGLILNNVVLCLLNNFPEKLFLFPLRLNKIIYFWINLLNYIWLISIVLFFDFPASDYWWLSPFMSPAQMSLTIVCLFYQPTFVYFFDFLYFSLAWRYGILSSINLYKMRLILGKLLFERNRFATMQHVRRN
jgi:hypothetical protein